MAVNAPIGVFDSGVGGLTVVQALTRALPNESVVYFGDTARVPYGNKSASTVTRLSEEALRFLIQFEVKAVVVACNSASAVAMNALRAESPVPVLGVVEAGAESAVQASPGGRIGVIGTRATVGSQCYEREIARLNPDARVTAAACPLFVPLAEEEWTHEEVTRMVAARYLAPIREASVDTVVLGCTHYPLLRDIIQDDLGADVTLIDSGDAVTTHLSAMIDRTGLGAQTRSHDHRFFVSDQVDRFRSQAARFLGHEVGFQAELVDQSDVPWYDRLSRIPPSPESP